jgi:hypothetical protein
LITAAHWGFLTVKDFRDISAFVTFINTKFLRHFKPPLEIFFLYESVGVPNITFYLCCGQANDKNKSARGSYLMIWQ